MENNNGFLPFASEIETAADETAMKLIVLFVIADLYKKSMNNNADYKLFPFFDDYVGVILNDRFLPIVIRNMARLLLLDMICSFTTTTINNNNSSSSSSSSNSNDGDISSEKKKKILALRKLAEEESIAEFISQYSEKEEFVDVISNYLPPSLSTLASTSNSLPFIRPLPTFLPISISGEKSDGDSGVVWMNPSAVKHEIIWDESMCDDILPSKIKVMELFAKALATPLMPAQQQSIMNEINNDNKLIFRLGLNVDNFPQLVEANPNLALDILLLLLRLPMPVQISSSPNISSSPLLAINQNNNQNNNNNNNNNAMVIDLLFTLSRMDFTLHTMDVVSRLTNSTSPTSLPVGFLNGFISNSIRFCDEVTDKLYQNRMVKLLSVFLKSLILNGKVSIPDILIELQQFCVQYCRIKEASTLLRLITTNNQ